METKRIPIISHPDDSDMDFAKFGGNFRHPVSNTSLLSSEYSKYRFECSTRRIRHIPLTNKSGFGKKIEKVLRFQSKDEGIVRCRNAKICPCRHL